MSFDEGTEDGLPCTTDQFAAVFQLVLTLPFQLITLLSSEQVHLVAMLVKPVTST